MQEPGPPRWGAFLGLLLVSGTLVGCVAAVQTHKESTVWERGRSALNAGMSASALKSCAGDPYKITPGNGGERWSYGVTKQMSFASAWCVLTIGVKDGRTTGFSVRSANPGGMSDGSDVCAYILDRCVGDGKLIDGSGHLAGYVTMMQDDSEAGLAQQSGEAARNAGMALAASGGPAAALQPSRNPVPTVVVATNSAPRPASPTLSIAEQNAINNAAYAAQVKVQRDKQQQQPTSQAGFGKPISSTPPTQVATASGNQAPVSRAPSPPPQGTFTYRSDANVVIDYSRVDNDGSYNIYITNTGNANLNCKVSLLGKYDAQAGMPHVGTDYVKPFSQTGINYVPIGSTVQFRFHGPGFFQVDSFNPSCSSA